MRILELLNLETGSSIENLRRIIATAPRRYKVYDIPKRNGGTRTIAHPARELKLIQRILLKEIFNNITVSPIATAYVEGRGILTNAKAHVGQRWILKLDFENFFHSITPADWDRTVRRIPELKPYAADRDILHRILFWGNGEKSPQCLSIGAPTSPAVSNFVCSKLDEWLLDQAKKRNVIVTRYADDISVSGPNVRQLNAFHIALSKMLDANQGLALKLNEKKTGIYGPAERRMITGLILTPDGEISIGRERKREISALIHRFSLGECTPDMVFRGKGLLAFAKSVEPLFFHSMERKYGEKTIKTLLQADSPLDFLLIGI